MGLANMPAPLPSTVWFPLIAGFVAVPQHTPRADIDGPLPAVALPPDNAVLAVTEVVGTVVTVGKSGTGSGASGWQLKEISANSRADRMYFIYYGLKANIGNNIWDDVGSKSSYSVRC